jgi:hypothetical protein
VAAARARAQDAVMHGRVLAYKEIARGGKMKKTDVVFECRFPLADTYFLK